MVIKNRSDGMSERFSMFMIKKQGAKAPQQIHHIKSDGQMSMLLISFVILSPSCIKTV